MKIIVGSHALKKSGLNRKEPLDKDVWIADNNTTEIHTSGLDVHFVPEDILNLVPTVGSSRYATPDAIYTIKCSHFQWDIMWEKTKLDILWLKGHGCTLIPELYSTLVEYWKTIHGDKSFLSLDKDVDKFFNDCIKYKYDHDYLHELVAFPNKPMYTRCLKENQQVLIDKGKFSTLNYCDQVRLFREEISVIAFERWIVHGKLGWYRAYKESLKKTIINLTKNWATDFIILNLQDFVTPDYSYFKYLLQTLKKEEISMSNVDLSIFEEIATRGDMNVGCVIYHMCENNFYDFNSALMNYEYEHLEQEGGGEGGAEGCHGVFKLDGTIYKAEYSYYSYNGHEIYGIEDTLQEVTPVEKTITVYE